jgi:hypothetical protein
VSIGNIKLSRGLARHHLIMHNRFERSLGAKWISLGLVVAVEKTKSQIERVGNLVGGEDKFQL